MNLGPRSATVFVVQFLLLAVVRAEDSSGSGCSGNSGLDVAVPLSHPSSTILPATPGLILAPLGQCGGSGCIRGWKYCYYSLSDEMDQTSVVTFNFSLWRLAGGGVLQEVTGSRFTVELKTLPQEQWLVCEKREVQSGCGVAPEEGDMVGVITSQEHSLELVAEVEGGLVMVGEREKDGRVRNSSLRHWPQLTLLVSPIIDPNSCTDRPSALEKICSSSTVQAPTDSSTTASDQLPSGRGADLMFVAIVAGLGLVALVLLVLLCFTFCILHRRRRSIKKTSLHTVLPNSHRRLNEGERGFDMHTLDTNTGSSSHSSSFSPTPIVRQLPELPRKKPKPLPRKPHPKKEAALQPREVPQSREAAGSGERLELPCRSSLVRSHSEEAIQLHPPTKEGGPLYWSRLQRGVSTGSLPTPCLDEDDYTIPVLSLSRTHRRPQPYLQPRSLHYSYAYSHVMAGAFCTAPRAWPAATAPRQSNSSHTDSSHDDYDEIFVNFPWKLHSSPPTSAGVDSAGHTPSGQHRFMSTSSEGYMNSDEYPRPGSASGSKDQHRSLLRYYTQLQPTTVRENSATYDLPRVSTSPTLSPTQQPSADYDLPQVSTSPPLSPTQQPSADYDLPQVSTSPTLSPTQQPSADYDLPQVSTSPPLSPTQQPSADYDLPQVSTSPPLSPTQQPSADYDLPQVSTSPPLSPTQQPSAEYDRLDPDQVTSSS